MALSKQVETNELDFYIDLASRENYVAAPVSCFKHVALSRDFDRHVVNGLLVEAGYEPDEPEHRTIYWIASVVDKKGSLVKLRFLGADPNGDFWRNFLLTKAPGNDQVDKRVHPVGWARKNQRPIEPPRGIREAHPDWRRFLEEQPASADKVLVVDPHPIAQREYESSFRPGMKVETTDITQMDALTPAVVEDTIGLRIRFKFLDDGIEKSCWFHEYSDELKPPGTWSSIGRKINSTEEYKERTKNKLERLEGPPADDDAPIACFKPQAAPRRFSGELSSKKRLKEGKQVEVIDPLRPGISVATIVEVLRNGDLRLEIVHKQDRDPKKHEKYRICVHESSDSLLAPGFAAYNKLEKYFNAPTRDFRYQKSTMAPRRYLRRVIPENDRLFTEGQILEVNGVAGSNQIYVGRIVRTVGHLLLIHFEGWGEEHDHFFPMSSVDLYHVGYCHSVGLPLTVPTEAQGSKNAKKPTRAPATRGSRQQPTQS